VHAAAAFVLLLKDAASFGPRVSGNQPQRESRSFRRRLWRGMAGNVTIGVYA
jgi:hypothetical protein